MEVYLFADMRRTSTYSKLKKQKTICTVRFISIFLKVDIGTCYGLDCVPPNSYVETPNPSPSEHHCIQR